MSVSPVVHPGLESGSPSHYVDGGMEAIVFCGIQGSGKSTFFKERFFLTHVRINLDMLKTRHREALLLRACLEAKQPFVIDNTNPTVEERQRYIAPAKAAGFRIIGYHFLSDVADALRRNEGRPPEQRIPLPGVLGTQKRLQAPTPAEGYDALFVVRLDHENVYSVREWRDEV